MANITFLGTGLLGSAFAEAAAKRGDTVSAWNRSPDKLQALIPFGIKAAATPADAVRGATRVHLILKDDAAIEAVIAAARPGLAADTILIDHSTTLPRLTAERAARLQAEGLHYLHCPVFMGPAAARQGLGSMLAAGPKALFERVQGELAKMTGRLEYLGERPDLAAVNKLLGNTMLIGSWAVLAVVKGAYLGVSRSARRAKAQPEPSLASSRSRLISWLPITAQARPASIRRCTCSMTAGLSGPRSHKSPTNTSVRPSGWRPPAS